MGTMRFRIPVENQVHQSQSQSPQRHKDAAVYQESSLVPGALANNQLLPNSCTQDSVAPANQNHQPIHPVLPELPAILPQNMHVHSHLDHQSQPVVAC